MDSVGHVAITVNDLALLIKTDIDHAPDQMMWRELLRNCFEAELDESHHEQTRIIRI